MAIRLHAQLRSHRINPSLVPAEFWPGGLDHLDGKPKEPTLREIGAEMLHAEVSEENLKAGSPDPDLLYAGTALPYEGLIAEEEARDSLYL